MRYLFSFFLALIFFQFVSAAVNGGCGTPPPTSFIHYSDNDVSGSRVGLRWVPVAYHIVAKADGTGGESLKDVLDAHCELNEYFQQFNIGFYIFRIDTIKNDALYFMSDGQGGTNFSLGYQTFSSKNVANKCNVYITGELPGLCGFATFPNSGSSGGGLFLNQGCTGANDKTFPHEMGHYFNLAHTFETAYGVEFVDGTNCSSAGDGFCDTPADFCEQRTPCPYTGSATDPHGDLYSTVIDESLFMSYFYDNCVFRVSQEEEDEMNSALSGPRSNLLNQTLPDVSPLDSTTYILPVSGDTAANSSVVTVKWQSVPRANYYMLRVQLSSSSVVIVDTVITDTTFTVYNLAPNKTYKYRVRPVSYGNTCGELSHYNYVQMSPIKAIPTVIKPSCPGEADATAAISASNGLYPYRFLWSTGDTTSSTGGLSAGIYTVTITDSNNEIVVANVSVTEPLPISATINKVGNNLNADGVGGTAPYTYQWSNSVTGQYNNNVASGTYSVTVTDSKGCTAVETFLISSTGIDLVTKVSMKVFPNPAAGISSLQIQLELNERVMGTVSLVNVNGEIIMSNTREYIAGNNTLSMDIDKTLSGVYFIQFKSSDVTRCERVVLMK